jgi:hypothetical protein
VVFDPGGFRLRASNDPASTQRLDRQGPSLLLQKPTSGPNRVLVAYQQFDDALEVSTAQGYLRSIELGKDSRSSCATADECLSRYCVQSVCCNDACGPCGDCASGICIVRPLGAIAGDYRCSGTTAEQPTRCTTDADCADGRSCHQESQRCVATVLKTPDPCLDAVTLRGPTGDPIACLPYRCQSGRCLSTCGSTSDCGDGYVCDFSGACVTLGDDANQGCATTHGETNRTSSWLVGLALAIALRHRRKHRA